MKIVMQYYKHHYILQVNNAVSQSGNSSFRELTSGNGNKAAWTEFEKEVIIKGRLRIKSVPNILLFVLVQLLWFE